MKVRLGLGFLIIVMVLCSPSLGFAKGKVIRWKVQGFVPAGMLYHDVLVHIADEVKRATDGRLVWQVFSSGALVPPFEGVKAVSDGVYQVNYGYSAQWVGKIPGSVAPLFCSVPGGFNWVDMQMWLEHGGGKQLEQEMYDKNGFNVKLFHGPPLSMESFMWAKKPLRKLEDFKGLKMRMMPLMGDVLSKHGMSVVFMPAGEIMPNLQRGVIDAAEYSIPAFDKTLGIWEVCKYVTLPGIHQPAGQTEILINKKAYAALSDDLKAKLEMAIYKTRFKEYLWTEFKNLEAVEFFNQKGIKTVVMEKETISTITKWANDYLDELAAKDEFFAKVWGSQKEFGKKWYPYATTHNLPH
jgi:TRAP-type mannitol/chloroaromatic compound transport system substrate-binding protein